MSSANTPEVVILSGRRTPQGKLLGQLSTLSAVELGAVAIRAAVADAQVAPADIDVVYVGHVIQAGAGQNPARQAAVHAGLPLHVPAITVNSVCLSGLDAVAQAARAIRCGEAQVAVAGGQESMSKAPFLLPQGRTGHVYGTTSILDATDHDALTDAFDGRSMGLNTAQTNDELGITRAEQDALAALSHQRAAKAWEEGIFDVEIAPVSVPQRKGEDLIVDRDQGIRPETTPDTLAALRPAFAHDGGITAGNSSPISDGAAALVLASKAWAEANGHEWLAEVGEVGFVAGPDTSLHSQPANAIKAALDRAGLEASDLDFVEINEAFAAVGVQSLKDLDYPLEKTNIHGGAIALGHPVGASGARLTLHAAHELARRGSGTAAVALCGGGGQGYALILRR